MMPATTELLHLLTKHVAEASESQADPIVSGWCRKALAENASDAALYDLLDKISKLNCGQVTPFVTAACNVTAHYERPSENSVGP